LNEESEKAKELAAKVIASNPAAAQPRRTMARRPTSTATSAASPMTIRSVAVATSSALARYPKCKNTGEVPARLIEELGIDQDGKKDAKASTTPMPEDAEHHDDVEDAAA
jgi:hypothetical protein